MIAQEADSTVAPIDSTFAPSDSLTTEEVIVGEMMEEDNIKEDDFEGKTVALISLMAPEIQYYAETSAGTPGQTVDSTQLVTTMEETNKAANSNLIYASAYRAAMALEPSLRVAEVDPTALAEATQQILNKQEFNLIGGSDEAEFIALDFIIQGVDYKTWYKFYTDMYPETERKAIDPFFVGRNDNGAKVSSYFLMTDTKTQEVVPFLSSPDGFRSSPRILAEHFVEQVNLLTSVEDYQNRVLLANYLAHEGMARTINENLTYNLKFFGLVAAGAAAHGIIQGGVFTKLVGGGFGYLWWFLRGWNKYLKDVNNELDSAIAKLSGQLESQNVKYASIQIENLGASPH